MSRLMIQKIGDLDLIGGIVQEVREGSGSAAGKVTHVKLKDKVWNGEKKVEEEKVIDVSFWNRDDATGMAMTERLQKAKVRPGVYLTALVKMTDDKSAKGLNFKYRGVWKFEAKDDRKEMNIFVGTVASLDPADGRVRISMPEDFQGEVIWHSITFWDKDDDKLADRAKKCLSPRSNGQKMYAVVVAGENKPYNERNSYTGFRFELFPEEAQSKKEEKTA